MIKKSKTTMVATILLLGSFFITGIATGNATSSITQIGGVDLGNMSDEELSNMPEELSKGLGQVFGMFRNLGPSGAALGQVFSIILGDFMNIEVQDTLIPHVYMLNATYSDSRTWGENFSSQEEIRYLWRKEYLGMLQNQVPYVEISKSGNVTFEYSYGASAVIIIWDNDDSFITAIQKVINAFKAVMGYIETAGDSNSWTEAERNEVIALIVGEVLEAVTYLLIHINDMINGDELIVTNIITWDSYSATYSDDFAVTKIVKIDDGDGDLTNDDEVNPADVATWIAAAEANDNDYIREILSPMPELNGTSREWSHFTFNLIEIWLKNFEIHINVAEIVNELVAQSQGTGGGGLVGMPIYEIFQGLDIEIYLMTHSLKGFITYNDSDGNDIPSVQYTNVGTETDTEVISDSEAVHYFVLGDLGDVIWNEPALTPDHTGISWSLKMNNPEMAAIPIGMGPQDVSNIVIENLEFIEMGFTFTPKLKETVNVEGYSSLTPEYETVQMAKGLVKLDQYFGTWNTGAPNNPELIGLDFSVIFISTITHFHVHFEVEEISETPDLAELRDEYGLLDEGRYVATETNQHGQIKVGRFESTLPVAAVDIAGPEYLQGDTEIPYNASTTILPLAFFAFDAQAEVSYVDTNDPGQNFKAGGFLTLNSSVMIYAVNYPTWNGSGDMIWHDPTFSVFMTWDNPGFWAVILVIGGVTLVAVAAVMITRRKNRI